MVVGQLVETVGWRSCLKRVLCLRLRRTCRVLVGTTHHSCFCRSSLRLLCAEWAVPTQHSSR